MSSVKYQENQEGEDITGKRGNQEGEDIIGKRENHWEGEDITGKRKNHYKKEDIIGKRGGEEDTTKNDYLGEIVGSESRLEVPVTLAFPVLRQIMYMDSSTYYYRFVMGL
ncbi:hypothetical protein EV424DRAFT_1347880 [Suillus variegatus]|nr:hypothetical protein EV424DRAFT_1347880 [Suillus variegatus]